VHLSPAFARAQSFSPRAQKQWLGARGWTGPSLKPSSGTRAFLPVPVCFSNTPKSPKEDQHQPAPYTNQQALPSSNTQGAHAHPPLPQLPFTSLPALCPPSSPGQQGGGLSPVYPTLAAFVRLLPRDSAPRLHTALLLPRRGRTATPRENHRLCVTDNWHKLLAVTHGAGGTFPAGLRGTKKQRFVNSSPFFFSQIKPNL